MLRLVVVVVSFLPTPSNIVSTVAIGFQTTTTTAPSNTKQAIAADWWRN